jgi:XisI protein
LKCFFHLFKDLNHKDTFFHGIEHKVIDFQSFNKKNRAMDFKLNRKIIKHSRLVKTLLTEYVAERAHRNDLNYQLLIDPVHRHYQVILNGWQEHQFVHRILFHLEVKTDAKIWIWVNKTELDIGTVLGLQGVPLTEMVLGFYPVHLRELSDYAVS